MNISEDLKDFLEDNDLVAKKLAEDINNITIEYKAGAYPEVVRDELLEDAYQIAEVHMQADELDTKVKLEKLYSIIKSIAGGLK